MNVESDFYPLTRAVRPMRTRQQPLPHRCVMGRANRHHQHVCQFDRLKSSLSSLYVSVHFANSITLDQCSANRGTAIRGAGPCLVQHGNAVSVSSSAMFLAGIPVPMRASLRRAQFQASR